MGYARASGATICLETPATGFVTAGRPRRRRRDAARHDRLPARGRWRPGRSAGRSSRLAGLDLELRPRPAHEAGHPGAAGDPGRRPDDDRRGDGGPLAAGPARRLRALHRSDHARHRAAPTTCRRTRSFAFDLLEPGLDRARWPGSAHSGGRSGSAASRTGCSRPASTEYTPDHRPYLGPSAVPGWSLNCGYSGHGIMASAGGSRLTIDALLGRVQPDENPFRPDRRWSSARSTSCERIGSRAGVTGGRGSASPLLDARQSRSE